LRTFASGSAAARRSARLAEPVSGLLRSIVGDDWRLQRLSQPLAGSDDWPPLISLGAIIVGWSTLGGSSLLLPVD
jgi:hypothetical protein